MPSVKAFRLKSPPLPSGEPSLNTPYGLDRQVGQFTIRQAIQEVIDGGPCDPRAERAQRHRLRWRCLLTNLLRWGGLRLAGLAGGGGAPNRSPCRSSRTGFRAIPPPARLTLVNHTGPYGFVYKSKR
jgi:hypothetical protein